MNKIVVVCQKEHEKGYEDYVGVCLLCEIEKLKKREWVGLTDEEIQEIALELPMDAVRITEAKLKKKNGYAEEKNT